MSNTYEYRIYREVYDSIVSGNKKMEIRLLNDKSEKIKLGDEIRFKVVDSDDYLLVRVTNKLIFNNIDELWQEKDVVLSCAMDLSKEQFTKKLYEIFGEEKVSSSKIVAIGFELL